MTSGRQMYTFKTLKDLQTFVKKLSLSLDNSSDIIYQLHAVPRSERRGPKPTDEKLDMDWVIDNWIKNDYENYYGEGRPID